MTSNKGVLLIYTGGTIGSMPKDPNDEASPQVVVDEQRFIESTPELKEERLGFRFGFRFTSVLLDSCNIGPDIWKEISAIIYEEYNNYEGFVVLHGTDTMVYTATALSFLLVNLGKPVVLTGAQRTHLFQVRNDGLQNMLTAIALANPRASNILNIPEVMILFGQDVLRGNRTRKRDANGYAAYESPKFPPLAKVGADITVNETLVLPKPEGTFRLRSNLELSVIDFNVFPGAAENKIAELLLDNPKIKPKGVVVRSYGAGNIPTDPIFLKHIENSINNNTVFYNVTQCTQGRVELGLYETSNLLLGIGMVSGTDLTPEAALVKLMVGLGDEDLREDPVALRNFLQQNQAGEQSTSIIEIPYPRRGASLSGGSPRHRFPPDRDLPGGWQPASLERAVLRLFGAEIMTEEKALTFEIYANLSSTEALGGPASPNYAGSARRASTDQRKTILSFDVSEAARALLKPGERGSFTLVLKEGDGTLTWNRAELALFVKQR